MHSHPHSRLLEHVRAVLGKHHVLTSATQTRPYRQGYRYGGGEVLAVLCPGTLLEQWQVLKACVEADVIIIMQAANTGLTGGSTPFGEGYDRPIVIINTRRIDGIQLLHDGRQVVCLPGATLHALEKKLAPLQREPHSVLGSSCVGASVVGGVCNNSGGALVRRGPVYTELALYAELDAQGKLQLVNHLGIALGDTPETILQNLEAGHYTAADIATESTGEASNHRYKHKVTQVDEPTPARFNNDPENLREVSGCAGKLAIFAVRLDTFPQEASEVFHVASNDPDDLTAIRRHFLTHLPSLPLAGEYLDRAAFTMSEKYGKDTFLIIRKFGTEKIPALFALKSKMDGRFARVGIKHVSDKVMQFLSRLFPRHLPDFMMDFGARYEHHLIIRVAADSVAPARAFLTEHFKQHTTGTFHHCDKDEGEKAFLHRFAASGAAARFKNTHARLTDSMVSLDIALPRNTRQWVEELPPAMDDKIVRKLYYGHFFCHVFHQIYVLKKGEDPLAFEHRMWELLDARDAEYPAEHNVGHLYIAKPELAGFYQKLDPTNTFNPGIGHTPKKRDWVADA